MEQPGDRTSRENREPRTDPDGGRNDPQGPARQIVHGVMSPHYIGRGHRALEVVKELLLTGPARTGSQQRDDRRNQPSSVNQRGSLTFLPVGSGEFNV